VTVNYFNPIMHIESKWYKLHMWIAKATRRQRVCINNWLIVNCKHIMYRYWWIRYHAQYMRPCLKIILLFLVKWTFLLLQLHTIV
jgi:hypothetical protein